ncbi:MAG TPA: ACP S-malonyltransferase [Candidatus Faecousia intestinavium]|nr:ACP S-malonyltransferase [Candidatus Faecousia intestinavium]
MGGVSFLFSGQGDQFPGMGQNLYETYPAAREAFDLCESLRPGTLEQCFRGTAEELKETRNTQPCLFAMELAAAAVLEEKGIVPEAAAGFSLGEVTAAAFTGIVDRETGFRLVCKRGALMQAAAEQFDTSMAAVVKLAPETVQALCSRYSQVYPVNFNCPGQITVSGLAEQMTAFAADVKAAGGRAIPLKVGGAFHSPFMEQAAQAFADELANAAMSKGRMPLYSNVTARPYDDNPRDLLSRQIASPVLWERIIRNMADAGVDTFIEIGPGKTLTNMVKKILPQAKTYCVAEMETLLKEVAGC